MKLRAIDFLNMNHSSVSLLEMTTKTTTMAEMGQFSTYQSLFLQEDEQCKLQTYQKIY